MEQKLANIAEKALDKIPTEKVYEDLAQAGLRKAGQALSDILDIVTIPLLPLLHTKRKIALYFDDNLRRYEETLQKRADDPIQVPELIGVPLLQKLTYASTSELADAFINLLAKASFDNSIHQVHPAFVTTLSDLSRDEAVMLKGIQPKKTLAVIHIDIQTMKQGNPSSYQSTRTVYAKLTGLEKMFELHFPQNISLYLHNLERLGIFRFDDTASLVNRDEDYQQLETWYAEEIETAKKIAVELTQRNDQKNDAEINRGVLRLTPFGLDFIYACLSD